MNKPSPHPQVYWRKLFFAVGKMTTFQSRSNSEGFASTHKCPHGIQGLAWPTSYSKTYLYGSLDTKKNNKIQDKLS